MLIFHERDVNAKFLSFFKNRSSEQISLEEHIIYMELNSQEWLIKCYSVKEYIKEWYRWVPVACISRNFGSHTQPREDPRYILMRCVSLLLHTIQTGWRSPIQHSDSTRSHVAVQQNCNKSRPCYRFTPRKKKNTLYEVTPSWPRSCVGEFITYVISTWIHCMHASLPEEDDRSIILQEKLNEKCALGWCVEGPKQWGWQLFFLYWELVQF